MSFKRRLLVKIYKLFGPGRDSKITREERCLMIIVKKLLSLPDSDPLMMPNMRKAYIRTGDRRIFVVVDFINGVASVINHSYGYDIKLSKRVLDYVGDNFIDEVERRRNDMEAEYMSNVRNSLSNVIKGIGI